MVKSFVGAPVINTYRGQGLSPGKDKRTAGLKKINEKTAL